MHGCYYVEYFPYGEQVDKFLCEDLAFTFLSAGLGDILLSVAQLLPASEGQAVTAALSV